ncbi:hypothetical protein TRICI_006907 [Trichomonascus ciferrii]|uniref:Uncharacterized protein n=1 Tax=Trichomonascus ciferrii TaxID=44093 RepID=A0A642UEI2_9ASCO|nr:hypothetical protein TRICI_006907 [Trichomonascus ciferrii]
MTEKASATKIELYGGAITSTIPSGFVDVSNFRQVPDTQEVFVCDRDGYDDSVVFDIMERVEGDDVEAVKEHLNELSVLNSVGQDYITLQLTRVDMKKQKLDNSTELQPPCYLSVAVEPSKKWGREEAAKDDPTGSVKPLVVLVMAVIRLENVTSDILLTYNIPIRTQQEITDLEALVKDKESLSNNDEIPPVGQRINSVRQQVVHSLQAFTVEDWSLFG